MYIFKNIIKILQSPIWNIWIIIGMAIIAVPTIYFIEKDLIIWNLWYYFYITEVILSVIIWILFWLFIGATLYKIQYFQVKKSWAWFFGWILGVLVSGCPACSITLASYIWLAGLISTLPYYGLELKVLSIILLLYSCYSTLKSLELCSIKIK